MLIKELGTKKETKKERERKRKESETRRVMFRELRKLD